MSLRHVTVCDYCGAWGWSDEVDWAVSTGSPELGTIPMVLIGNTPSHEQTHLCGTCRDHVWHCTNCQGFHQIGTACSYTRAAHPHTLDRLPTTTSIFADSKQILSETPGIKAWSTNRGRPAAKQRTVETQEQKDGSGNLLLFIIVGIILFWMILSR